jgi:hypothetical protein
MIMVQIESLQQDTIHYLRKIMMECLMVGFLLCSMDIWGGMQSAPLTPVLTVANATPTAMVIIGNQCYIGNVLFLCCTVAGYARISIVEAV